MIFLIVLALIWIIFASICDIKKREVPDWLNYSLLIFALAYRLFYSVLYSDWGYFLFGLMGAGIFFIVANLFYYGRIFAGGDAKLLMALGAVIPFSYTIKSNLILLGAFLFLLLVAGSAYGIIYSAFLISKNKKRFNIEFKKQFKKIKMLFFSAIFIALAVLVFALYNNYNILILFSIVVLLYPLLFSYAKAVEESCMIKQVLAKDLTEGDWLYKTIKIGKIKIDPNWEGLTKKELRLLRRYKGKILIKQGIPFVPVFLIAFILLLFLGYSPWNFYCLL